MEAARPGLADWVREQRTEMEYLRGEASAIVADTRALAAAEVQLARAEMRESAQAAAKTAAFGGLTLFVAIFALLWVLVSAMLALDLVMPLWAASLVVLGALVVIAAVAGLMARNSAKQIAVMPKKAIAAMREDVQWLKTRQSS